MEPPLRIFRPCRDALDLKAPVISLPRDPEQMELAGQHPDPTGPLSGPRLDDVQRILQVLPCGGGPVLGPDPVRPDPHGHQRLLHTGSLRHGLVRPLTSRDHSHRVRVFGKVAIGRPDPLLERRRSDPGPQHQNIVQSFLRLPMGIRQDPTAGDSPDADPQDQHPRRHHPDRRCLQAPGQTKGPDHDAQSQRHQPHISEP